MASDDEDKKKSSGGANGEENKEADDLDLDEGEDDDNEDEGGEGGEGDEDENKPITLKHLKDFRKGITDEINSRFTKKRHDFKDRSKNYQSDANRSGKGDNEAVDARLAKIELNNAKYDFGQLHSLSRAEVEIVFKFANNKPTAKTLDDPFVKGGLERLRTQSNLRDNTPSGSGSSNFEVEGKKWEDLKPDEKQKNFGARQRAILSAKGGRR